MAEPTLSPSRDVPDPPGPAATGPLRWTRILLFGFVLWALLASAKLALFRWKLEEPQLFGVSLGIVVVACTAGLAAFYLLSVASHGLRHGIAIGAAWFVVVTGFDLVLQWNGSLASTVLEYFRDIGLANLMIPLTTIATAHERLAKRGQRRAPARHRADSLHTSPRAR